MKRKALLFDIDGTFSETEEVHRRAFNETFEAFGLDWHWDQPLYKKLLEVTGGKERMRYYIDDWAPPGGAEAIEKIPAMHADKTDRYTALIDGGAATLRPGIERIIREAKAAGIPVAIATTTSLPNIEALVKATLGPDGMALFDAIAGGDSVKKKKPAPDIYRLALEQLGLGPEDGIAFEDSINGLRSATAAGLPSIITPSVYTDDQDFTGAFSILSDLGEPDRPYTHIAGAGAGEPMVTAEGAIRWLTARAA
ncbi:MAG: HAD family hydrolase [Bauldia sp.]|nr:HAD family hydrolase [Bauldia sp.]